MGTIKLIFGIGIIVVVIYLGIQVIPAYYSNYEFQDTINRDALDFTYKPTAEDDIKAQVMKDAKQYDIDLGDTDVKVVRSGGVGNGSVSINVNYVVHVGVPLYPFDLHFNPSSANKGFY
jgi:hypothetical protein